MSIMVICELRCSDVKVLRSAGQLAKPPSSPFGRAKNLVNVATNGSYIDQCTVALLDRALVRSFSLDSISVT